MANEEWPSQFDPILVHAIIILVHQALPEEFPGLVDALTTGARIYYEDKKIS